MTRQTSGLPILDGMQRGTPGLPPRMDRLALVLVSVGLLVSHVFGAWMALLFAQESRQHLPGVWITSATSVSLLTVFWRGVVPRRDPRLWCVAAAVAGIPFVVNLLGGMSLGDNVLMSMGWLLQAILIAFSYRFLRGRFGASESQQTGTDNGVNWYVSWQAEWTPRRATDLLWLALACAIGTMTVVASGMLAGCELFHRSWVQTLLFAENSAITAYVGTATMLLLTRSPQGDARGRRLVLTLFLALASAALVAVLLINQSLPISWVVVIPAMIAGATLRPWGAAFQSLVLASTGLSVANSEILHRTWSWSPQSESLLELLTFANVTVSLTLALLQQQRRRLVAQVRREKSLATGQARFLETVLDGMSDGVIVARSDGEVIYRNPGTIRLLRPADKSYLHGTWPANARLITESGKIIADTNAVLDYLADIDRDPVCQMQIDLPNGLTSKLSVTHRRVSWRGQPHVVFMLRDVTAQVERETALRDFAAAAAHDLRGPLTSLTGWVDLAREESEPDSDLAAMLQRASTSGARLDTIIEDWLQYSVKRDGKILPEPIVLADLVREVAAPLVAPDGSGHTPTIDVGVSHSVMADAGLIRQVLSNILSNALKYARHGVDAEVLVTSTENEHGVIRVDVRDNGIGIPAGQEDFVFGAYQRGDSVEGYEGSGLGLSVCREIVHRHGGEIWASRNDGHGTTISFTLPGRPGA